MEIKNHGHQTKKSKSTIWILYGKDSSPGDTIQIGKYNLELIKIENGNYHFKIQ